MGDLVLDKLWIDEPKWFFEADDLPVLLKMELFMLLKTLGFRVLRTDLSAISSGILIISK